MRVNVLGSIKFIISVEIHFLIVMHTYLFAYKNAKFN